MAGLTAPRRSFAPGCDGPVSDVGRGCATFARVPLVVLSLACLPRWPARRIRGAVRLADRGARRRDGRWSDRVAARTRHRVDVRAARRGWIRHRSRDDGCVRVDARRRRRAGATLSVVVEDSVGPGGYVSRRRRRVRARMALGRDGASARRRSRHRGRRRRAHAARRAGAITRASRSRAGRRCSCGGDRRPVARSIEPFGDDAPLVRALLIADRSELDARGARPLRRRRAGAHPRHRGSARRHHRAGHRARVASSPACLDRARDDSSRSPPSSSTWLSSARRSRRSARRSCSTRFSPAVCAQRPTSRWAIVALGAAQPLVDPRVVLDVGYQLSVVGVTAMIAAARVARRIGVHRLPSLARARRADPHRYDRRDDRIRADRRMGVRPHQPRRRR